MFVPSTSDARVVKPPIAFTKKARAEVINNLTIKNDKISNDNDNDNGNDSGVTKVVATAEEPNDLSRFKSRTSSLLPSFLTKYDKDRGGNNNTNNNTINSAAEISNSIRSKDVSPTPSHQTQTSSASSLRSNVYSSALPSYHQLTSPITRTMTSQSVESTSSGSIFSSMSSLKSISTSNSSVYEADKVSLPSISNVLKSNTQQSQNHIQIPQAHARSQSIKSDYSIRREEGNTISLEKAISDLKDFNLILHRNIGFEVFTQLNEAIAEILKAENLQLIDWNLNLIRCSLIVNELPPSWNNEIPEITVNGNRRYKIQDGFQSELVKLISSYRRQQKNYLPTSDLNFKKFIKNVMQNRFLVFEKKLDQNTTVIKFNKNIKEEVIKIQLIPEVCSEDEFIDFLTNSDLFKEFNLEKDFRRKVATISIKQSRFLQSLKTNGKDELLYPYKILSLRNFFLNLLVASQTLFEFHYTINELLGKEDKDREISEQEMKWLWDNIRERNFKKIEVFDKFY